MSETEMSARDVLEALVGEVDVAQNEGMGTFDTADLCLLDEGRGRGIPCMIVRHGGKFFLVEAREAVSSVVVNLCEIAFAQVEAIEEDRARTRDRNRVKYDAEQFDRERAIRDEFRKGESLFDKTWEEK